MNKLAFYQTAHMDYPYTLPPLDYAYDALEPHIDEQTMHLHHDKHHQLISITPTKPSANILRCRKQI